MLRDNLVRRVEYVRTIDGDTFRARFMLAEKMEPEPIILGNIRVANWNAKELSEEEGPAMRDIFHNILDGAVIINVVMRTMSFNRVVCDVYIDDYRFTGLLLDELRAIRRELGINTRTNIKAIQTTREGV